MTIRALQPVTVDGVDHVTGDTFEALPESAMDLIRLGYAEEVEPPAEPPAGDPIG